MGTLRRKRIDESVGLFSFLILVWLLALLLSFPVKGETRLSPEELARRVEDSGAVWRSLSDAERETTRALFVRFLRLRAEDRNRAIERYRRFRTLPAEAQERARANYRQFASLPEAERAQRLESLRRTRH